MSGLGQQTNTDSNVSNNNIQAWTMAAYKSSYICFYNATGTGFTNSCKYTVQRFTYE